MNNYTMTIDKKTRFVIMYKGEVIKKYLVTFRRKGFRLDFADKNQTSEQNA